MALPVAKNPPTTALARLHAMAAAKASVASTRGPDVPQRTAPPPPPGPPAAPRPTPPPPSTPQMSPAPPTVDLNRRAAAALTVLEQRRQQAHDAMLAAKKQFYSIESPSDGDWDACKARMAAALARHDDSSRQAKELLTFVNALRDAQFGLEEYLLLFEASQRVDALRETARQAKNATTSPFDGPDGASLRDLVTQLERAKP